MLVEKDDVDRVPKTGAGPSKKASVLVATPVAKKSATGAKAMQRKESAHNSLSDEMQLVSMSSSSSAPDNDVQRKRAKDDVQRVVGDPASHVAPRKASSNDDVQQRKSHGQVGPTDESVKAKPSVPSGRSKLAAIQKKVQHIQEMRRAAKKRDMPGDPSKHTAEKDVSRKSSKDAASWRRNSSFPVADVHGDGNASVFRCVTRDLLPALTQRRFCPGRRRSTLRRLC